MHQQKTSSTLVFLLSTQNLLVFKISLCFTSLQAYNITIMNRCFSHFKAIIIKVYIITLFALSNV